MPRLFFAGDIGDIQRMQVGYASECKLPSERTRKGEKRVCKPLLGFEAKSLPPKTFCKV